MGRAPVQEIRPAGGGPLTCQDTPFSMYDAPCTQSPLPRHEGQPPSAGMALVRCYAELNDALPPWRRYRDFPSPLDSVATVGDLMASLAIPLGEVDLVLRNGESVSPGALLHAGDRVALFPVFESFDIGTVQRIRPQPLRAPRFVLDAHLGKLAGYLRMLGFDAAYTQAADDETLVGQSLGGPRILLSRDRALAADPRLTRAILIRSEKPEEQLQDVVGRFQLQTLFRPFTRCMRCNEPFGTVTRDEVLALLPPRVRDSQTEFHRCPTCKRVYWQGTHQDRMRAFIHRVLQVDC